jgi:3-phosphoshikimate 1-carboxyvinyltransferase
MRLLAGVLASAPFRSVLTGDDSLSRRPMERVAEPLRAMGADVETLNGHAPMSVEGGALRGIEYRAPVASAQLKSAVLLAATAADGRTSLLEPAATRDHTERALATLGAPITSHDRIVVIAHAFQHAGFEGRVPGDPSAASFLVAAAAVTGSEITVRDVGLNPTRIHFLTVLRRMGVRTETRIERVEVGEPVGDVWVASGAHLTATTVPPDELPLVVDEVPVLASVAAHATGESTFAGAGELRVKESDRLAAMTRGIRALHGAADEKGDDLVVAGGGLAGGAAVAGGDHRVAMALSVAALGASGSSEIDGMESADISFPGFVATLAGAGARAEMI